MARRAQSPEVFLPLITSSSGCEQRMRPLPSAPLDVTFLRALPSKSPQNNAVLVNCKSKRLKRTVSSCMV